MKKLMSVLLLIFAILSLLFLILLVFLKKPFPLLPLASYQDAFDILTPLVLIPLYWLIFHYSGRDPPRPSEAISFLILAAFWMEGQGMHLSANAISNLMVLFARNGLVDVTGSDIFKLTYFFDEHLGHYLWHIGVLGLAALLIYREWVRPAGLQTVWWSTIVGGIMYGLTLFMITNEGQTVWMGLPFSLLVSLFGLIWGRKQLAQRPVLAFFFVACLVALLVYVGWGLYWGGFPEFSEVGLI